MSTARSWWNSLKEQFLAPRVSEEQLEQCLRELQFRMPAPVFWLLGKTQSGKTSLIRALTGNTQAEIGSGLRPCTRTARQYSFPSEQECLLRFLDTRGLGEAAYDPAEDLALFENQSHLLILVLKATDHAQQAVLEAAASILQRRPEWPVLVVQTSLHEGYPTREFGHLDPYPFEGESFLPGVPSDLARSLLSQRKRVREQLAIPESKLRFAAVDLTLPEDGYTPVSYGLDSLWRAIEDLLPLGLRSLLARMDVADERLRDLHESAARPHILAYSVAAGVAGAIPVPMLDIPLVLSIQGKMFHTLAAIYHQDLGPQRIAEIFGTLGLGYLGRMGARELFKVIPGIGSAAAGLYNAACTYALGWTLCRYFERQAEGVLPSTEEFRAVYAEQFEAGRELLARYLSSSKPVTPEANTT